MSDKTVLLSILVKNKEYCIKWFLKCIELQDYPKDKIVIYIRANDCIDKSIPILKEWVERHGSKYKDVIEDYSDIEPDFQTEEHEWTPKRFHLLAKIRDYSMNLTLKLKLDYYYVVDADNFVFPKVLKTLVNSGLDLVGPLLTRPGLGYSNYHNVADKNGYFQANDGYFSILNRTIRGLIVVDVIHCTYLISAKVIPELHYYSEPDHRHEYVIFSESARKANVLQYIDNREVYGRVVFDISELKKALPNIKEALSL